MDSPILKKPVKWAADVKHVREVSLRGEADLAFWADRLLPEALVPIACDGHAQIMIIAADARFMGMRFRELSVSVLVSHSGMTSQREAALLHCAFNSSRLFAWCERNLFSTPYHHGLVRVSTDIPAAVQLTFQGKRIFEATMNPVTPDSKREASSIANDGWEGPIFLPDPRRRSPDDGKLFVARIAGKTHTYPFLASHDTLTLSTSSDHGGIQALSESRFVPREWVIREDAVHAKSKTYRRSSLAGNSI